MFEAVDGDLYFTAQWFYRAQDTLRCFFCTISISFKPFNLTLNIIPFPGT
ncbi:hypothetical protein ERO13_A13G032050v2 [Gossypium hirsutum]|nr:hypothetical protein ERO13_A13G032050v2 [Gossypium hirsutum]